MTPAEIQRELDELDTRLERLRIKYDQFFTGIEKMLPYVQRKDVDRRFQALQRVQMRNTGMRFRFQTLVQRFTSYQTYWNRITRQIEEGTFRRDVMKAQRMGLGAAAVAAAKQAAEGPPELPDDDVEELDGVEPEPEAPIVPPPLKDGFRDPLVGPRVAPAVVPLDNIKEPSVARPFPTTDPPSPLAPPQVFSMPPQRAAPVAPPLPPGASRAPPPPPGAQRPPVPGAPSLRAPPPPPAAASGAGPAGVPLPPGTRPSSPGVPAVGSGTVPSPVGASAPRPPQAQPGRLGVVRPPAAATASTPPAPAAPAPAAPTPAAPQSPPAQRPVASPAQPPRPAAPSMPARPAPAPAPAPSARPPAASGEDAMRQLYDRYVAARKQTGESIDVRYETVAKQVRETLPRLAEKYQGADVRLDVTIKDGKAILRPVVTMKKSE